MLMVVYLIKFLVTRCFSCFRMVYNQQSIFSYLKIKLYLDLKGRKISCCRTSISFFGRQNLGVHTGIPVKYPSGYVTGYIFKIFTYSFCLFMVFQHDVNFHINRFLENFMCIYCVYY